MLPKMNSVCYLIDAGAAAYREMFIVVYWCSLARLFPACFSCHEMIGHAMIGSLASSLIFM
jgi:hypothetical protein